MCKNKAVSTLILLITIALLMAGCGESGMTGYPKESQNGLLSGGNSRIAAGTDSGSFEQLTWTKHEAGTRNRFYSVVWNDNQFLIVGDQQLDGPVRPTVFSSADGSEWAVPNPEINQFLSSVFWGGDQFVAVGGDRVILTSPDGVGWAKCNNEECGYLFDVAWNGSQYVAVGNDEILTSPDGVVWTGHDSGTNKQFFGVTWGNGRFAAVGEDAILTSSDGSKWTKSDLP